MTKKSKKQLRRTVKELQAAIESQDSGSFSELSLARINLVEYLCSSVSKRELGAMQTAIDQRYEELTA